MARPLKVAVQMDPIEPININGDSSFALMLSAQARGHQLWHYEVKNLLLREGVGKPGAGHEERVYARARPVRCSACRATTIRSARGRFWTSERWTWC